MKMIKNILLAFSALALAFMSAACSDINSPKEASQNSAGKAIVVNGSLSAGSGRSAISSYTSDTITWDVTACPMTEAGSPDTDNIVEATVNEDMSFSITFTKEGDYLFFAKGTIDGKSVLVGNANANIKDGTNTVTITVSSPDEVETGKISLVFTDATQDSLLATLSVYENAKLVSTDSFTDKNALFEMDESTAGLHIYKFCFNDQAGNTIYTCREAVTVFGGLTTDTWQGKSPYFVQDEDGSVRFEINDDLITKYGAEVLPDTGMMLYNAQYDEDNNVDGYKYYLANSAGQTITSDTQATVTTSSSDNSFCFDGNGYYYVIAGKDNDATYIKSNKPDFGSETLENTNVPGAMYLYGDLGKILTVDRFTNILYMFDGSNDEISQITKDDGEYVYKEENSVYFHAKTFKFSEEDSNREKIDWESVFTVYDGVAYFASVSEGVNLVIAKLENAVAGGTEDYYNITGSKLVSLELGEMNLSSDAKITDMLYQDGAVYMLLRDFNPDGLQGSSVVDQTYYSRGAVIKYDVFSGLVSNCGWTNEALSDAGKKLYGYYMNSATSQYEHYFTANDSANNWKTESAWYAIEMDKIKTYMTTIFNFALYVPSAADTNAFYGPQKFIAVKPKKLIISDEGVAFYTDANGAFRAKNVNRIVTVDLEKFAIADSTDSSATFGAEESSGIFPGTVYWNTNQLENGETIYISNGSSWSKAQEENVFVGIPLSE